jgi:ribosomal protein S18 acetylase RimI-like enzyme
MLELRPAGPTDLAFLREVLLEAVFWRSGETRPSPDAALADPRVARYVEGWGRSGDFGVLAEKNGRPIGAVWWRYFAADAPGYGFVSEAVPEISLAVLAEHRGQGVGTALLREALREAPERGIARLSLSVERDNRAVTLYERMGFRRSGLIGNAWTMVLENPSAPLELTPLHVREFFGRPWSGEGEWKPRPWLAWLPGPRRLRFRSFTTWLTDEVWLVHDTTTWADGRIERRDFLATLIAPDRIRFTGAQMPGGCEIQLAADGFSFSPYVITAALPVLPVPVLVRCVDRCRLEAGGELVDTIDVSFLSLPLGRQVVRLRPE